MSTSFSPLEFSLCPQPGTTKSGKLADVNPSCASGIPYSSTEKTPFLGRDCYTYLENIINVKKLRIIIPKKWIIIEGAVYIFINHSVIAVNKA